MRILPKVLAEFLLTQTCRIYFQTHAKATTGNFPKIDQKIIGKTPIPLPPIEEQYEIEQISRTLDRKITLHQKKYEAQKDLFRTLLPQLMTAQIRVHDLEFEENV